VENWHDWLENPPFWMLFLNGKKRGGISSAISFIRKEAAFLFEVGFCDVLTK